MNAHAIECRAQRRANGSTVSARHRPIIASRPLDASEGEENKRRLSVFYQRYHGQAVPRIEIMRFTR